MTTCVVNEYQLQPYQLSNCQLLAVEPELWDRYTLHLCNWPPTDVTSTFRQPSNAFLFQQFYPGIVYLLTLEMISHSMVLAVANCVSAAKQMLVTSHTDGVSIIILRRVTSASCYRLRRWCMRRGYHPYCMTEWLSDRLKQNTLLQLTFQRCSVYTLAVMAFHRNIRPSVEL